MTIEQEFSRLLPGAQYYASIGWKILPVHGIGLDGRCTCGQAHDDPKDVGKHPAISDWQNQASSDPAWVESAWQRDYRFNPGVMARNSGFLVVDIDPRNGGFESFDRFESLSGGEALPPTVEAMTGAYTHHRSTVRGRHLYYRVDPSENLNGNLKAAGFPGIDIKHNGYVLLTPSRHLSGVEYEWLPGHAPWEVEMAQAPEELLQQLRKGRGRSGGRSGGTRLKSGDSEWFWVGDLEWGGEKLDIDRFLNEGIEEGSRAVDIYAMACALANKYGTGDGERKFIETMMIRFNHEMVKPPLEVEGQGGLLMHVHRAIDFVADNPKTAVQGTMGATATAFAQQHKQQMEERESRRQAAASHPQQVQQDAFSTYGTSDPDDYDDEIRYADADLDGSIGGQIKQMAFSGRKIGSTALDMPKDQDALTAEEGGDPSKRSLSDLGNGRRLVDSYQAIMRYTPGLGWFNWDGQYWEPDTESLKTKELSKKLSAIIAREVVEYDDSNKQTEVIKWANQAKANRAQSNAIESATSDPRVLVEVEGWDNDSTLLGVANGVINLKTGELMKGRPDLYITRRAPVRYSPGVRNPRWEQFLDYATGGDKEYQEWLQRAAGYTLSGLRTHDVMFLVYGPGGSGKNVFCEALVKVLGTQQYAWPMDSQILAQGDGSANGSDLYHWAELRGRRMVWVDELPESERLKENSVKKLTGSSEISARSPGEKPFTFQSRAKLWITTNHRPIISDDAMWRRIRPIPWMNVPEKPDPGLKEYIFDPEGGLPGVLAWAVEGAMKILNSTETDSLGWCKVVSDAAEVYRKNEDRIGMFLNEETAETPGSDLPIRSMFSVYQQWSEDRGEKPMSQIAFQRKLTERGFQITGQGRKAVMGNRSLIPRTASTTATGFDWDQMMGNARW